MRVAIAGGHGQIARRLSRLLSARGDVAVALIRNPDQVADIESDGGVPAVLDLESASVASVAAELGGCDSVVFAAGAGPGSGAARKDTVDRAASVLLADGVQAAGVHRFIQVSAMGLGRVREGQPDPSGMDPVFAEYLRAKKAAEDDLRSRPLNWTIVRPGRLTNAAGTGRVLLADSVPPGQISREDVAAVLLALLDTPQTAGITLELVAGDDTVDDAVARIANS